MSGTGPNGMSVTISKRCLIMVDGEGGKGMRGEGGCAKE
jgi:hypothetical protein